MKVDRFFGQESQARVAEAVKAAEARSDGEIVPVVVEKSDAYPEVRWRGAALAAALATGAVFAFHLDVTLAELPLLQLFAGVLGALLSLWDPLERLLAGPRALDEAARFRAERAFLEHGLHRTRSGTGVLVFASLFEREVVVLGDRGIHAKMGEEGWRHAVDALVAGMKRRDPAAGFVEAIRLVGDTLAQHFPPVPGGGDGNELPDALRRHRE
jgi:putative membrane protein